MADAISADASPNLNLTPEEKRVFGQLFRQADTENIGVVTGEVAVKFFEKTRLEPRILGEIWQIADKENRGLLTPAGFGIVLRLIGHYQAGQDPTPELAYQPGPLPKFDGGIGGIQPPPGPPPSALQPQASGQIRVPPLTPEKVNQYAALFEKSGAQNGVLPGEQAKQIFERAGLPNEVLGRIWNLADTEQRGALVVTEFIIAMHLLASFKSGSLNALPQILPAGLYEAAARRGPVRQLSTNTTGGPLPAIPRQFSGTGARVGSPLGRSNLGSSSQSSQPNRFSGGWDITPADKAQFDNIYVGLDKTNKGFITGDEAVPFFSNSKLSEDVLAQIWDLADINSVGRLTKDEFAVAMFLIRQQRSRRDGRDTLPSTLPPSLIPPSMRNQNKAPSQPTAPAFESPAPAMSKSAVDDLFGLDAFSAAPLPPTQAPMSTGGSTSLNDPFSVNRSPGIPSSPVKTSSPQQPSGFKPFIPTSSFGQSISSHPTGTTAPSGPSQPRGQISAMDDLLGDNDPEVSKQLTNETTELANLSNQVGNLSKQMQEVGGQRTRAQNDLNQASALKREFETRLAQLRVLYEQEVKDVRGLQERITASRNESKKLQTDIAIIEGTYQDLQNQHEQMVTALRADQQENGALKERMKTLNAEISTLKPQLEKLRSEARQQKGLVAINKKQLSTNEAERDKLVTESDELTKSNEETARAIAESSRVQSPAAVASPALSTMSATNPFFRRQASISSSSDHQSTVSGTNAPPSKQETFDNLFGPSFGSPGQSIPRVHSASIPPTSFKQDSTASTPKLTNVGDESVPRDVSRDIAGPVDPPAPPESRQISSSFLPFGGVANDSLSSSRQVSPPASRYSEGSTTEATTPTGHIASTPGVPSALAAQTSDQSKGYNPEVTDDRTPTAAVFNPIPLAGEGKPSPAEESNRAGTPSQQAAAPKSVDPFAASVSTPAASATKDDFDAAFADFGGRSVAKDKQVESPSITDGSSRAIGGVNTEFPPLRELQNDESDSDSSNGGFDDDFTGATPGHSRNVSAANREQATTSTAGPVLENNSLLAPMSLPIQNTSAMNIGTNPPTPGAQASPPTYDAIVSPHDRAHAEVAAYQGLLPDRGDPTSPPASSDEVSKVSSGPAGTGLNSLTAPPVAIAKAAPPAKVPFDSDDDFDGLEDAKEGDADDDFANISVHDRSALDFDPTFDSPITSKAGHHTGAAEAANGFGNVSTAPATLTSSPSDINDARDWDAIFATLDSPSAANAAPAISATAATKDASSFPSVKANGGSSDRPELGRALTTTGEHDDPILKDLTNMGYPRKDALEALEKYDYNLERAANYLASQS